MKSAASIFLLFASLLSCGAQSYPEAESSDHAPNSKFEVVVFPNDTDPTIQNLTIRNRSGETNFAEQFGAPPSFLWKVLWRADSNYVAITAQPYQTEVDTFVLHRTSRKFRSVKLSRIPMGETYHVVANHWKKNEDLALDISSGNNRRTFRGDIISSYSAVVRFQGHPPKARIVSRTKLIRETVGDY